MTHFSKKAALLTSLVIPFSFGAATVSAAEITEWAYNVDNSFSNVTFTEGDGTPVATDTELSWGSDSARSSVSITGSVTNPPNLITNGDFVPGGVFQHDNQSIPASASQLASFQLDSVLSLEALEPESLAGTTAGPIPVGFQSFFTETFNGPDCFEGSVSNCDASDSASRSQVTNCSSQSAARLRADSCIASFNRRAS